MAFFGIRIQSLLAAALCLIILRSVDGGTMITVGGMHGWQYSQTSLDNKTSAFDYQEWISNLKLTDTDGLDFGAVWPVSQVSLEDAEKCDASKGIAPGKLGTDTFGYNLSSASARYSSGQFGFISPDKCLLGMKFAVNILVNVSTLGSPIGPFTANTSKKKHSDKVAWIVGTVAGVGVALALLAGLVLMAFLTRRNYWQKLRKSSGRQGVGVVLSYVSDSRSHSLSHSSHSKDVDDLNLEWPCGPKRFTYKELKGATDNFKSSLVVGEGGFGTVYKGYLRDSPQVPVAVKRLSQYARQGAREFIAEVNIISQLRHRNLVHLLGWCDENDELILVYEYMPNGDVDDLIFGHGFDNNGAEVSPLSWQHRYNIFCGVATALIYLHEEWEQRVVHRDVKTSNVMLDSQFNARLGDFGLARLSAHSQAPRTTMVAGTIGYLAPEFSLTGRATDKTDVYAFGVVVLEVSCARRPLTSNCILLDWVWELHKEEKLLDAVDPKLALKSVAEEEEMKLALKVGLLCCHPDPAARPTMRDVLNILTGKAPLPKMPRSKPVAIFPEDQ